MACKNILLFYNSHSDKLPPATIAEMLKVSNKHKFDISD